MTCLCPTYLRPDMLRRSVRMFLDQDYPADRRLMLILDDGDQIKSQSHPGYTIVSKPQRCFSLSSKYNELMRLAPAYTQYFLVWEDDDEYQPGYISSHIRAHLATGAKWTKASRVRMRNKGVLGTEDIKTDGFHAILGMTRQVLVYAGGWPNCVTADFDQQFQQRLGRAAGHGPQDTIGFGGPAYVFNWHASAETYQTQGAMQGANDYTWWERIGREARSKSKVAKIEELLPAEVL